jgi:hypothetical protein
MKRLMLMAMVAATAGALSSCVSYPARVVVVRPYGYRSYGPYGGVWVPGHYGRWGRWHRGHWE